jgi:hypothetical protein
MSSFTYRATITPKVGGSMIEVTVQANDVFQARKIIESLYAPTSWHLGPVRV